MLNKSMVFWCETTSINFYVAFFPHILKALNWMRVILGAFHFYTQRSPREPSFALFVIGIHALAHSAAEDVE